MKELFPNDTRIQLLLSAHLSLPVLYLVVGSRQTVPLWRKTDTKFLRYHGQRVGVLLSRYLHQKLKYVQQKMVFIYPKNFQLQQRRLSPIIEQVGENASNNGCAYVSGRRGGERVVHPHLDR